MNEPSNSQQTLYGVFAGLACAAAAVFYLANHSTANGSGGRGCRSCRTAPGTAAPVIAPQTSSPLSR